MGLRAAWAGVLFGALGIATAAGAGCGGSADNGNTFGGDGDAGDFDGALGEGGGPTFDASFNTGDSSTGNTLVVNPPTAVLDVVAGGAPASQQFTATKPGSSTPVAANWSMDTPGLGTIDATGLFKASGTVGGAATVTAQSGNAQGTAKLTIKLHISENPGNVDPGTQGNLKGGGASDPAFKFVYPYDATVFPRGLLPPLLQFAGSSATAFYVHVSASTIDYQGFFGGGTSVTLSPATWNSIVASVGPNDPLKVQVTKIVNGAVTGPTTETWTIAQGNLKGTLYYNSYNSALGGGQGAVLRIKPAATQPEVLISGCTVCHAVSANGSTLVANHANYTSGASYDLSGGNVNPPVLHQQSDSSMGFGALYPDGSLMLSNASIAGTWHSRSGGGPNVVGFGTLSDPNSGGERPSHLYDTKTGAVVGAPGFDGVVTHALMPQFAPDGKKVAFNSFDTGSGRTLSVMDFAVATKTFSNLTQIVNDQTMFPGWPFFTPDSKAVIFHVTDNGDYATLNYDTVQANKGLLKTVDLATKTVTALDAANGYANGQLYLPFGADDQDKNYEPTVLPIAVGGYYWVVFTSRRDYGNLLTHGNPMANDRKKLWVAAIDINPTPGKDPSHPAFYLPGQEATAGNMRGFWALDPCNQNGNDCSSGDECCTGFCRQVNGDAGAKYTCVPPPQNGCANEFEHCTTTADCCGAAQGYSCINGFCAKPPPR